MPNKITIEGGSIVVQNKGTEFILRIYDSENEISVVLKDEQAMNLAASIVQSKEERSIAYIGNLKVSSDQLKKVRRELLKYQINHEATVNINLLDKEIPLFDIEKIQNACGAMMEEMGFELETEDHPVYGSFFQWLKFKTKQPTTQAELEDVYNKGKLALEAKYLNAPMAEATEKYANAAGKLLDSISNFENAVIRLGALLVIKTTENGIPQVAIQTISPTLAAKFDEEPELLKSPQILLDYLNNNNREKIIALEDAKTRSLGLMLSNSQKTLPSP